MRREVGLAVEGLPLRVRVLLHGLDQRDGDRPVGPGVLGAVRGVEPRVRGAVDPVQVLVGGVVAQVRVRPRGHAHPVDGLRVRVRRRVRVEHQVRVPREHALVQERLRRVVPPDRVVLDGRDLVSDGHLGLLGHVLLADIDLDPRGLHCRRQGTALRDPDIGGDAPGADGPEAVLVVAPVAQAADQVVLVRELQDPDAAEARAPRPAIGRRDGGLRPGLREGVLRDESPGPSVCRPDRELAPHGRADDVLASFRDDLVHERHERRLRLPRVRRARVLPGTAVEEPVPPLPVVRVSDDLSLPVAGPLHRTRRVAVRRAAHWSELYHWHVVSRSVVFSVRSGRAYATWTFPSSRNTCPADSFASLAALPCAGGLAGTPGAVGATGWGVLASAGTPRPSTGKPYFRSVRTACPISEATDSSAWALPFFSSFSGFSFSPPSPSSFSVFFAGVGPAPPLVCSSAASRSVQALQTASNFASSACSAFTVVSGAPSPLAVVPAFCSSFMVSTSDSDLTADTGRGSLHGHVVCLPTWLSPWASGFATTGAQLTS